jgi:opacity protein-like surface antigen
MNRIKLLATAAVAAGALFALEAPVSAQTIGFKVGPTFSKFDVSDSDDTFETLKSFGGGGFLRFGMAGLAMQAEALAITKGAEVSQAGFTSEQKLTYLEVPVLARFSLGTGVSFSPYLMVGPSFGFELSCKATLEGNGISTDGDCEDEGEDSGRKKFDVGAAGVAGVEFRMGPGALLVEGRYTHGLTNLNDGDSDINGKIMNRSFAVMAGYTFTLK